MGTRIESIISQVGQDAIALVTQCSSNNVIELDAKNNNKVVDKLEELLECIANTEVQKYFESGNVTPQVFCSVLYCLNALANYRLYNQHLGDRAREIALLSKCLAEEYLKNKLQRPANFQLKELADEEKLKEMSAIADFAEMYTIIIYTLARTYIYKGERQDAVPYFEMVKFLGCKLNLFEGFLSAGRGLAVVQRDAVLQKLKEGSLTKAEALVEMKKITETYKSLQIDTKEYKEGFKPGHQPNSVVVPANDSYNWMDCSDQLTKCYILLVCLTDDKNEQNQYFNELTTQFIGADASTPGALQSLNKVQPRKAASVLHSLGKTLIVAYDRKIDFSDFKLKISKELTEVEKMNELSDLEFIEKIFKLVEEKSKPNDFTLADAFDGLKKVHKRQLMEKMSELEYDETYTDFKKKRDEVNKNLGRSVICAFGYA
jgi:hypothetical protein